MRYKFNKSFLIIVNNVGIEFERSEISFQGTFQVLLNFF